MKLIDTLNNLTGSSRKGRWSVLEEKFGISLDTDVSFQVMPDEYSSELYSDDFGKVMCSREIDHSNNSVIQSKSDLNKFYFEYHSSKFAIISVL